MANKNYRPVLSFGLRTVLISLVLLVLLVGLNIAASLLPIHLKLIDTSYNALYTLSSTTAQKLSGIDEPVTVYFLCSDGTADNSILTFLRRYESVSRNITVKTVNTTENSSFSLAYTDRELSDYSVIVEGKRRSAVIDYYDLYLWEDTQLGLGIMTFEQYAAMMSSSSSYLLEIYPPVQHFNGEAKITNAVSYVTSENVPKIYAVSSHGETAIGSDFRNTIKASAYDLVEGFSLLAYGGIPADCDTLLFHAPTSDITAEEAAWILSYLEKGGNLFLSTAIGKQYSDIEVTETDESGAKTVKTDPSDFPNLMAVLKRAGLSASNGVIVEPDSKMSLSSNNTMLLPKANGSHAATSASSGSTLLLPSAHAILIDSAATDAVSLFTTSASSYTVSVGSTDITKKDEYSLDGPFAVGAYAKIGDGEIVWYASGTFLTDYYDTLVSGGNHAYAIAAFDAMNEKEATTALPSVSLEEPKLIVTDQTAMVFASFLCGVIPFSVLLGGFVFVRKRRRA